MIRSIEISRCDLAVQALLKYLPVESGTILNGEYLGRDPPVSLKNPTGGSVRR